MSSDSKQPEFKGSMSRQLTELRDLIDWLWKEHGVSYVKAGDDRVYAFGDIKYLVVFDESKWEGVIEFITPKGALTIKPGENGNFDVSGTDLEEKTMKEIFKEGIAEIRKYYDNRYWKNPQAVS